jgi:hypothetical protein
MVCVGVASRSSDARSRGLGVSSLKVMRIISPKGANPSRRARPAEAASSVREPVRVTEAGRAFDGVKQYRLDERPRVEYFSDRLAFG